MGDAVNIREMVAAFQESMATTLGGFREKLWTLLPVVISQTSQDGHTATAQVAVNGIVQDSTGNPNPQSYPILDLLPITHPGGGGVVHTFAVTKGDEGIVLLSKIPIDSWWNQGGTNNNPTDTRTHSLSDGMYLHQHRSNPRKLQQVSTTSAQLRSDTQQHCDDLHPTNGFHRKTCDPSTPPASASFSPFTQATTFFEHILHPTNGIAHNAVKSGTTHAVTIDHTNGPIMSANNLAHFFQAIPGVGTKIQTPDVHTVNAPQTNRNGNEYVSQNIVAGISMSAPTGSFGSGSIGGFSFGSGGGSGATIELTEEISAPVMQLSQAFTVASLNAAYPPTTSIRGLRAYVTDATGVTGPPSAPPTFLTTLVGSGTYVCPAFCDGSAWKAG